MVWKRVSAVRASVDAVVEVGEGADDVGADVAVLGEDDRRSTRTVVARGSEVTVTVHGPGGERHPAEVDAVAGDVDGTGVGGEAQACERLGGRVGARRHGGEQQRAGCGGAGGGAVDRGRERDGLVGHERQRGGPVGGAPAVVHLRLDDRGEREHDRGQRREEAEHQHPAPVPGGRFAPARRARPARPVEPSGRG